MGKKSTPSPDARIGQAADQLSQISQENWDWFKNTYIPAQQQNQQQVVSTTNDVLGQYMGTLLPTQTEAYNQTAQTGQQAMQSALGQMQTAADTGDSIYSTFNSSYMPLYSQIASEAAAKGGQADQDYQAMLARGDVSQAFANNNGQLQRYLAQYGQSPTSGTGVAGARSNTLAQSAAEAAAQTTARQAAANLGWTYRQQAADVGANLLNAGSQTYAASQAAGNAALTAGNNVLNAGNALSQTYQDAVNTSTVPIQSEAAIGGGVAQGVGASSGALNSAAGALNQAYSTQSGAQSSANASSGALTGSVIGAGATIGAAVII